MKQDQMEFWKLEEMVKKGYLLNKHLLAPGEKPNCRPWGGFFEKTEGNVTKTRLFLDSRSPQAE